MWTRSELKAKAKRAFKANYWKSVLVAVLLAFLVGTNGAGGGRAASNAASIGKSDTQIVTLDDEKITKDGEPIALEGDSLVIDGSTVTVNSSNDARDGKTYTFEELDGAVLTTEDLTLTLDADDIEALVTMTEVEDNVDLHEITTSASEELGMALPVIIAVIAAIVLVVLVIATAIEAFLVNPLEVGARRFFVQNLNQPARLSNIAYAFDHGYLNTVKVLFLRDIKLIGWALLLIVPGIIKSYEYQMIPYLLAEDSTLDSAEAFAKSRQMMDGNKWKSFVLDLSFIGWELLSLVTLGIVGIFYVNPYVEQTHAALYEFLRYGNGMPDFGALPQADAPAADSFQAQA